MTGYVRADKPDLTGAEFEIYRGVYCSLCRSLGKNYTVIARLLLSYDFALAAIFRLSLVDDGCTFEKGRCPFNPSKRCWYCASKAELDFCAHCIIIIAYYRVIDNIHDREKGKKLLSLLALPLISLMHKKAKRLAPEAEEIVSKGIDSQNKVESKQSCGIDEAAHSSADMLGKIFSLGFNNDERENIYSVGYMIGRFVYLLDACDDLQSDIKSGNFNPFKKEFPSLTTSEDKTAFADRAEKELNLTQANLLEDKDRLHFKRFDPIIENILLRGLSNSQTAVVSRLRGENTDKTNSFTVK